MKLLQILFISFSSLIAVGQENNLNDTIRFENYVGIICDSTYTPYSSRNIFPRNRFTPTRKDVEKFELEFLNQYDDAIEKHHKLFYEEYRKKYRNGFTDEGWKEIEKYRDEGKESGKKGQEKLKKEFFDYDRIYYGFIGVNGFRYLRIHFTPHNEKWIEIPGTGESQLENYPPLIYNLDKNILSLAGWTGENEE